jgi:phage FluMu protein Com
MKIEDNKNYFKNMKKTNKILLANASWHNPILGIDCPKCGEWEDYYEQFIEHDFPFEICKSIERQELEGIKFKCPICKEKFELENVEW